jgi:hypothetical protein
VPGVPSPRNLCPEILTGGLHRSFRGDLRRTRIRVMKDRHRSFLISRYRLSRQSRNSSA